MNNEKASAFRLSTALSKSSSLSDILPFNCSISGKPVYSLLNLFLSVIEVDRDIKIRDKKNLFPLLKLISIKFLKLSYLILELLTDLVTAILECADM